jgi:hypothetical protein
VKNKIKKEDDMSDFQNRKWRLVERKTNIETEKEFFILFPNQDYAARMALRKYAEETKNIDTANFIRSWLRNVEAKLLLNEKEEGGNFNRTGEEKL